VETGEVIEIIFSAHYHLDIGENNTIKIKHLHIFSEGMPKGKSVPKLFGMEELFEMESNKD
jgi:hypothetical protein